MSTLYIPRPIPTRNEAAGPGFMPTLNELLHAASRTFAVGIDRLPDPLRGEVETAYLLLRVSDYLEDNESMEPVRKTGLLEAWGRVLAADGPVDEFAATLGPVPDPTPDALVARNVVQVAGALEAMRPDAQRIVRKHVRDSTLGMARWVARGPDLADEPDLDDYMHEVAGRVGWLLTELFALDVPEVARRRDRMMTLGREFGLALQTVNVIRGLHADSKRGWVYVPRSFLGENGAAHPGAVFGGPAHAARDARVLERLIDKAQRHLDAAASYIALIPRRCHGIRLFCLLPYLFAVRTLALSRGNQAVFREETKISRAEVTRIVKVASVLGRSNGWIRWYAKRLGRSV
jgi:farnesyl-diphosphate farnesyltransferase